MTAIITKNGTGVPPGEALQKGELAVDLDGLKLYTSTDGSDVVEVSASAEVEESPWLYVENEGGDYIRLKEEAFTAEGWPVFFGLGDKDGSWNNLNIVQVDGKYLYGDYAWCEDFEGKTLELGTSTVRAAVAKGQERVSKSVTRELDWDEVPLVVHGKIQAKDLVDEAGNTLLGGGDFEMPQVIDGGTY